jgi:integrase
MPEIYSQPDMDKFFAVCDHQQNAYFRTLLWGDLRMQEARWLEVSDIFDGLSGHAPSLTGYLRLTRSAHPRPTMAYEPCCGSFPVLKAVPWCSLPARASRTTSCCGICKPIAKRAGLDPRKWSLHGWRRTCLTMLLRNGVDVRTVIAIGGQTSMKAVLRYLRPVENASL